MIHERFDMLGGSLQETMETGYHRQQSRGMFVAMRPANMPGGAARPG